MKAKIYVIITERQTPLRWHTDVSRDSIDKSLTA